MGDDIVLIGMPGAGKSTVGVVLAKILNREFVDVDLVIQKREEMTLQNIIDSFGTERFIDAENAALLALSSTDSRNFDPAVISTGGSAVYSEEGMERLKKNATIIYLKVSLDELEKRLEDFSDRGVVMRGSDTTLSGLYEERSPLYEKFADVTVDISAMTITQSARYIAELFS